VERSDRLTWLKEMKGVAFVLLVACAACSTSSFENRFKDSYRTHSAEGCMLRAAGTALERDARAMCPCIAAGLVRSFTTSELVALTLNAAPKPLEKRETQVIRVCYYRYVAKGNRCRTDAYVTNAVQPSFPASARSVTSTISTLIEVDVAPNGALKSARVYKSSGNRDADLAALKAARASMYSPKVVNCHPIEARYLFRADFAPD
jgi:TonB family protein